MTTGLDDHFVPECEAFNQLTGTNRIKKNPVLFYCHVFHTKTEVKLWGKKTFRGNCIDRICSSWMPLTVHLFFCGFFSLFFGCVFLFGGGGEGSMSFVLLRNISSPP